MNVEYLKKMKCAEDAANQFFEMVQKNGDMEMLQKDAEIQELYLKAFDIIDDASPEERDFYSKFSNYFLYKGLMLIWSGELEKQLGNTKSISAQQLKPIYDELTAALDSAIGNNDKYKSEYMEEKSEIISEFNEELSKAGITVRKEGCYIATAVYGSYECQQVRVLRQYRDNVLYEHFLGRVFICVYYFISPILIKRLGNKKWFVYFWRRLLDKWIHILQNKGYEASQCIDCRK